MTEEMPRRRRPRVVGVVIVLLALFALASAIVGLSLNDGKEDPITITGASEVQSLLGGIQQDGARLGDSNAPVTIDYFTDLSCDPCSDYELDVIPKLVENYVRPGKAQINYRHFAMGQRDIFEGDFGALAAAQQDYEWQYVHLFFFNQDEAAKAGKTQRFDEFQDDLANAVLEMDHDKWEKDFNAPEVKETNDADNKLALSLKLPIGPAIVVTGVNGSKNLIQSPSYDDIVKAIDEVS